VGKAKEKTTKIDKRVTWAQAFRDIFIAAMNKGQLIPTVLGLAFLIWVWRIDPKELGDLGTRFLTLVESHQVVGYMLWIVTTIGWVIHARIVKGTTDAESGRIGKEKTRLQEQLASRTFPSSRR
jgi:hypothetical protein